MTFALSDESQRIVIAVALAGLAVASSVAIWCLEEKIVYEKASGSPADAWRLVWMVPFSAAGLSWRAWAWRRFGTKLELAGKRPTGWRESPWFVYLLKYPFLLALGNALAFAAMHSFLDLDNWLFYLASAIVALTLARAPGNWVKLLGFTGLSS